MSGPWCRPSSRNIRAACSLSLSADQEKTARRSVVASPVRSASSRPRASASSAARSASRAPGRAAARAQVTLSASGSPAAVLDERRHRRRLRRPPAPRRAARRAARPPRARRARRAAAARAPSHHQPGQLRPAGDQHHAARAAGQQRPDLVGVVRVVEQQQHPPAVEQACAAARSARRGRTARAAAARRARRRTTAAPCPAASARSPGRSRAGSRTAGRRGRATPTCRANRIASVVLPTPAVPVISATGDACGRAVRRGDCPGSSACSQSELGRPAGEAGRLGRQLGRARRGRARAAAPGWAPPGQARLPARPARARAVPATGPAVPAASPAGHRRRPAGTSSAGSIASSRWWILVSSAPGSMPRSSASRSLASWKTPQRLGLAPAPVQGDHQQPARPLAQRVLGRQRGQLGHRRRGLPLGEHQVGPFLRRGGAQLGQPLPLRLGEGPGHPGERLAAPQRERLVDRPRRAAASPAARSPRARLRHSSKSPGVEAAGAEPQQVAAARGDKHQAGRRAATVRVAARPVRLEHAAQPRHVGVDAVLGAGRRLVTPYRVDQLAARDHPVGPAREHAEHRELPRLPAPTSRPSRQTVTGPSTPTRSGTTASRPLRAGAPAAACPPVPRTELLGATQPISGTVRRLPPLDGRASRKYLDHL